VGLAHHKPYQFSGCAKVTDWQSCGPIFSSSARSQSSAPWRSSPIPGTERAAIQPNREPNNQTENQTTKQGAIHLLNAGTTVERCVEKPVSVHGSGTDAFSRRKTNNLHGRDKTPRRRLSAKLGLSPSLARERLQKPWHRRTATSRFPQSAFERIVQVGSSAIVKRVPGCL